MDISKIKVDLGDDWRNFEKLLSDTVSSDIQYLNTINNYLLEHLGKQLRPILSLLTAKCCGDVNTKTLSCAVTSEMIHSASLLHDDVVDHSDYRRGVATVHKLFSPGASVLMGDFWLSRAMLLLVHNDVEYPILKCITKSIEDLAKGELFQMEKADNLTTTQEDYIYIVSMKTASLFVSAAKSAVMTVTPSEKMIQSVESFAYNLGIAFQVKDDLFDYSPDLNLGKPCGIDIKERKLTLPLLKAIERAKKEGVQQEADILMSKIVEIGQKNCDVDAVSKDTLEFVRKYNGLEAAEKVMNDYIDSAIAEIKTLPDSQWREHLINIALFIGARQN